MDFPSKKDILLVQQSAANDNDNFQQSNATARHEVPPQQVDAGGMRMIKTMHYGFPSVQSSCSYACARRRTAALQGTERTKRRLAQSRSMWHRQ
jgi:hypothetical protein